MAHFVTISSQHGFEHINLDLVRRITQDLDGNVTLHFDYPNTRTFEGNDARKVVEVLNHNLSSTVKAA